MVRPRCPFEEIEHACMVIEWLRRNVPKFDEELHTYLFKDVPITEAEEEATGSEGGETTVNDRSLGIGGLKGSSES